MKIDEGGKEFSEKIKIDIDQKTEEIDVPAHGDRAAVDVLSDFNVVSMIIAIWTMRF